MCEKRYVFDAESSSKFSAADRCPAYKVPDDIVAAVRDKQRRDDIQTAELINRGTPAAPVRMGVDGGMNPTFLAAVKSHGGPGATIRTAIGTIPPHVNPPAESPSSDSVHEHHEPCLGRIEAGPRAALVGAGGLGWKLGSGSSATCSDRRARIKARVRAPLQPPSRRSRNPRPPRRSLRTPPVAAKKPEPSTGGSEDAAVAAKPSPAKQEANAEQQGNTNTTSLLNGAAPTMPSGGFESRFGAWR